MSSAVNLEPLHGPPDPTDKAPDPDDVRDFEVDDTHTLLDEFLAKLKSSALASPSKISTRAF